MLQLRDAERFLERAAAMQDEWTSAALQATREWQRDGAASNAATSEAVRRRRLLALFLQHVHLNQQRSRGEPLLVEWARSLIPTPPDKMCSLRVAFACPYTPAPSSPTSRLPSIWTT